MQRGDVPVALIAQDRVLVRRVRALLERQRVALLDETGWKLSTTRAAALVMSLLMAARADAGTDSLLDWLKNGTTWTRTNATALADLEATCRRDRIARVAGLANARFGPAAARLWTAASEALAALRHDAAPGTRRLAGRTRAGAGPLRRDEPRFKPTTRAGNCSPRCA